jgi:hypothetical protein
MFAVPFNGFVGVQVAISAPRNKIAEPVAGLCCASLSIVVAGDVL